MIVVPLDYNRAEMYGILLDYVNANELSFKMEMSANKSDAKQAKIMYTAHFRWAMVFTPARADNSKGIMQ